MKISLKWVEQFTSIELDREEMVRRIGAQLGAIEEIEDWGSYFDKDIVVGEIVKADDHPDADKLGVYEVKVEDDKIVTVCAGDKTLQHGDKVGYIPPGSRVPMTVRDGKPFTIEERDLRGVTSQGMMGSAKELLMSENHEGVLKLDTDAAIGTPLEEAYELDDLIVNVENKMFTHRPDLFGIIGIAREIAGIQDIAFKSPDWYQEEQTFPDKSADLPLKVQIESSELCPRFSAVTFADVNIKQSPIRMQSFLTRVGLRPINNVVDITNFGMYLTAQPTHAFDYDKVAKHSKDGAALVVRKPKKGEKLTLLDGREIEPHEDAAMVATDKTLISVGGSMGGADTEVDDNTKNVILEAASWDLYSIRRTSFAHGIFTDAVTRFNKGQSPRQAVTALRHMSDMFMDNVEAKLASGLIDEYPHRAKARAIEVEPDFINVRLGSDFTADEIARILSNVEIPCEVHGDKIRAKVPFWRMDLKLREDLVEEVGRLHGYDNLPINVPLRPSKPNFRTQELKLKGVIRSVLSSAGAKDVLSYNFVSEDLLRSAGYDDALIGDAYKIRNSLSPELQYMRISLLPSVIEKINPNIRNGYGSFVLFEVNKAHSKVEVEDELPKERTSLGLVVASDREQAGSAFYQAKAYLDHLLSELGLKAKYRRVTDSDTAQMLGRSTKQLFAQKRIAAVEIDEHFAGFIGEFSAATKQNFKLPKYSAGFEIDLDHLRENQRIYNPISKYPASTQDITLETPDQIEYSDLAHLVEKNLQGDDFTASVAPLAIYRSEDDALRRISFRVTFRSAKRTLKTSEINDAIAQMAQKCRDLGIEQV